MAPCSGGPAGAENGRPPASGGGVAAACCVTRRGSASMEAPSVGGEYCASPLSVSSKVET
eukprot:2970098-Alexandrium_andersonii.AAC.1